MNSNVERGPVQPNSDITSNSIDQKDPSQQPATRGNRSIRPQMPPNRLFIIIGGLLAVALLVFVIASPTPKRKRSELILTKSQQKENATSPESVTPYTGQDTNPPKGSKDLGITESEVTGTGRELPNLRVAENVPAMAGSLGSIPPFTENEPSTADLASTPHLAPSKEDKETPPSVVFARHNSDTHNSERDLNVGYHLGLSAGFRLRARLETAATTAIRVPVVAVVEYNYEHDGLLIVPAGSKAIGHIDQADRSGYLSIRFESLLFPNGTSVPIEALATDTNAQPLRGRVQGQNTGKQFVVRTLSGIGEVGALLAGRSNFNQPYSESDMLRERVGQNIGQASDQQLNSLAVTQHIVVSVAANTPIYVILQSSNLTSQVASATKQPTKEQQNIDSVRQLLQLQRELSASEQQN